ncbi:MAG TPA: hypothetical protein VL172_03840, partial [Kofleriaceae bacterium]|nr:hypothetical protein [Kofleriaceae bacterium]
IHAIPVGPTVSLEAAFPGLQVEGHDLTWGRDYRTRLADYGSHMMAIAIIGAQGKGTAGNIRVDDRGGLAEVSKEAYQPAPGAIEAARAIITGLGGKLARTPWERWGAAATVHPVGGCRMGDDPEAPVLAGDLSLRNPSHTIAAVAERAMDVIVGGMSSGDWPA